MVEFNKMFVMLPVMLAARKLDSEDADTVFYLRIAYFSIQAIIVLLVAYTFIQATSLARGKDQVVYMPQAPSPFADPNAKKKYTETVYSKYVYTTARGLLTSTLFGIVLTGGLHFYKGMVIGLAIQTIMGPLNLMENKLAKAILTKGKLEKGDLEEKTAAELSPNDEVVDDMGNAVVVVKSSTSSSQSLEEVLLDTWDNGAKADLGPLMQVLNDKNCNYATKDNGWTPIMVLSGVGAKGVGSAIRQVKAMGGDPAIVDIEGWNALHWAAFHGSLEAAKALGDDVSVLMVVKDKEGKTPLDHARAEGNDDVAKFLQDGSAVAAAADTNKTEDEGLRKRK